MSLKFKIFYEKYYMNKPESSKWSTTRMSRNPIRAYSAPIYRQASFTDAHSSSSSNNSVPLLRCNTAPTLPNLTSNGRNDDPKKYNNLPKKQNSLLNVFDDKDEPFSQVSASPSSFSVRTRVSSVSRCSTTSKTSWSDSIVADDNGDCDADRKLCYLDYLNMSKPYSFSSYGPTSMDGNGKSQMKNVSVTCNSVMGNPRKLGRRLIRRGSATEIKEDLQRASANSRPRPPMLRTQTMDNTEMKLRCNSNENVTESQQAFKSPYGNRKFVKQKSSADLSSETNDRPPHSISLANSQLNKLEKKRMEKLKMNMKNLLDLFTAVEQDDIGTVRSTLQHNDVDINGTNMDDLTLLDVAVMLNHNEVGLLLLKFGAQENPRLTSPSVRLKHLQTMIDSTHTNLAELSLQCKQSSSPIKSAEKQLSSLESRVHMLKKMRNNFENSGTPDSPKNVVLQVSSANSLSVSFEPPEQTNSSSIVTKYKIEWALHEDFNEIEGCILVKDLRRLEVTINSLLMGDSYFVRVSAGNFKGFSEPFASHPFCARPSSWREVDNKLARSAGRLQAITELYHELKNLKMSNSWQKIAFTSDFASKKKKTSFKNMFLGGSKFQKSLKRGIYLASILYKDDKILCSVDECLPIVEVDESPPSSIIPDYLWLMKLSCAWDDMKSLNFTDLDQIQRSSSLMFRLKLLEAASAMQLALGVQDLGRLHCSPIVDNRGVTILVTVQYVQDTKSVQGLTVKWMSLSKLFKRQASSTAPDKDINAMDLLTLNLLNVLNFYESTYIPLDRGLYLGYVKLHSTMSQISIVVPENLPSVLPFFYIRDNPHVSKEEWEWLRILDSNEVDDAKPTSSQLSFHWALTSAAKILLSDLEVLDDDIPSHRIYRLEVVEIHPDVSFILLVPAHADVCSAPGQQRMISEEKRGCFALPVPMFEVAHLCTYQPDFIALYCRLSVFLEFYTTVLQQMQRQTLNDAENKQIKHQLDNLTGYQCRLDDIWKTARWISTVATAARDKQLKSGLALGILFAYSSSDFRCSPSSPTSSSVFLNDTNGETVVATVTNNNNNVAHRSQQRPNGTTVADDNERNLPIVVSADDQPRPWRRRQERKRSSDQSSSDQGEDSSDVGYHSDQSIEKTGALNDPSPKSGGGPSSASGSGSSSSTTVFSSSHLFFTKSSSNNVEGLENPIYDFLTPTFFFDSPDLKRNSLFAASSSSAGGDSQSTSSNSNNVADRFGDNNKSDVDYFVTRMNNVQRSCQSKLLQQKYGSGDKSPSGAPKWTDDSPSNNTNYKTNISVGNGANGQMSNSANAAANSSGSNQRYGSFASLTGRRTSTTCSELSVINNRREYVNFLGSPTSAFKQLELNDCLDETPSVAEMTAFFHAMTDNHSPPSSFRSRNNSCYAPTTSDESSDCDNKMQNGDKIRQSAASSPTMSSYRCESVLSNVRRPSTSSGGMVADRPTSSVDRSRARSTSTDVPSPTAGVLRVYAAYQCGLAKGTSVKLQVTQRTTSKEVISLVVQQLNKAVKMKGLQGPFHSENEFDEFCLVAVIGARERCLRDDFPPLDLQNPWCKGKLFVRRRNDLLAALEFGNEAKV